MAIYDILNFQDLIQAAGDPIDLQRLSEPQKFERELG
jgi:hypothetical protein